MPKKLWRAHVVAWWMVEHGSGNQDDPDSPDYRYRILAEGDSWFSLGGIPTSSLLFSFEFPDDTIIVNCATPGGTIRRMVEMANDRAYRDALSAKGGSKWDLILLSGGGNDLIGDADDVGGLAWPLPGEEAVQLTGEGFSVSLPKRGRSAGFHSA